MLIFKIVDSLHCILNAQLLSKHCKDISKNFRLISNDFLAFTETHFKLSKLQTAIQTTLDVLNMHFNNNEGTFLSLAYGSQKSISITQKIDYHGISKISVKRNSLSNTIFNIVTIYRSNSVVLQQFFQHLRYHVHANNIHITEGNFNTDILKQPKSHLHDHLEESIQKV